MLQTVYAGLILAAISGLSYLAYKHPAAYHRLFGALVSLVIGAFLIPMIWDAAITEALIALSPLLDSSEYEAAKRALEDIRPNIPATTLICAASFIYICFLDYLPYLLKEKQKGSHDNPDLK